MESAKSTQNTADVSGETRNAGDAYDVRSVLELNHESDAKYVESHDETMIVESNGSENTETETDEEERDIQNVCEKDEEQGLGQLHLAAERGDIEAVRSLLMSSANVDVLNKNHNTPLHYATQNGHIGIIDLLLNKNASVNSRNLDGDTALHLASENGHIEVAEVLLRNNADANIRNDSGKTPFHIAAEKGFAEIVKAMIDHEGEVNAVDYSGDTALHLAAQNGHSSVVNVLLNQIVEMEAQIRSQLTVNQVPAAELELSQHPIKRQVDAAHISHLIAAEAGNVEIADTLPSHSSTVNAVFKGQATSFHLAAEHGHADVNACNNAKITPLHLACQNGHTAIVEILLDNHATVDVTIQSEETPFYLAAKNGHADIVDLLLRRGVCDFVFTNGIQTPLYVAVRKGHTEVVEFILKHSRMISEKLTNDEKKLQENTKRYVIPVELRKSDGRRVSAEIVWTERNTPLERKKTLYKNTPLALAVSLIDPKMVELLLSVGQYSESDIVDSFHYIGNKVVFRRCPKRRMDFRKLAELLINSRKFNVNHQDKELNTFLHNVLRKQYEDSSNAFLTKESNRLRLWNEIINDVIQVLLDKGADFNMQNSSGETPLIIASENGCCHAIQTFFDWEEKSGVKLDLDARDQYGATALIKAAEMHHISVMRLLLSHNASVNLNDHDGFTALHAAVNDPNREWLDLHFFCKGLRNRKFNDKEYPQVDHRCYRIQKNEVMDRNTAIHRLEKILERNKTDEMVKLLLANDETNVNAIDFSGNTPLDLAVKSSQRITSTTFEALKNRGAICNLLEPEDEAPIEEARVDASCRNPFHRLIISSISDHYKKAKREIDHKIFDVMVHGILLNPEIFRESANATDDKGRTPLHYAVMQPEQLRILDHYNLVRVLFEIGSNVSTPDIYGKTPLHYAEKNDQYELLVQHGAEENAKDRYGNTPKDLKQLRDLVTLSEENAELRIGYKGLCMSKDIARVLNSNHVTQLSSQKLVETVRIYSQSPRPKESSEETVWKVWIENDFIRLNRRLRQLKPLIKHFIKRLADGIKEKDWRFECQPISVGSADEETMAVISGDFDFNFKLIKFSQLCEALPHSLGPKGYFQLRRKSSDDTQNRNDGKFGSFFNSDQCLLTHEVNSRFQIILGEVLRDPYFWQDEHLFECNLTDIDENKSQKPAFKCKNVLLRMIHPIEDGEGGFLFSKISIDIVACIHLEDWWPEDLLLVGISPAVKANGCTMVFDQPCFDFSKPRVARFLLYETFARISFAPLENRIIKESSPLIKAAYIVCKIILDSEGSYLLKTCLLFCIEALNARNESETRSEDKVTQTELAFWVERIMFCFIEFSGHDFYPCYFMSSLKQRGPLAYLCNGNPNDIKEEGVDVFLNYLMVYDIYLDLCPDHSAIEIPRVTLCEITDRTLNADPDPMWKQLFNREEFIRKLSSRSSRLSMQL